MLIYANYRYVNYNLHILIYALAQAHARNRSHYQHLPPRQL